jgi:hypothetical protein
VRCGDLGTTSCQQVHKVRFVASTLLDTVQKAETAPASAARAHAYLCCVILFCEVAVLMIHCLFIVDFLSILSEIERNYMHVLIFVLLITV